MGDRGFLGLGTRVRSFGSVTVRRKTERLIGATGAPDSARGRGGEPGGVARDSRRVGGGEARAGPEL